MAKGKTKSTIKSTNYFVVSGWMVNELELKGNELLTYAIIYGFTQDGNQWFEGSRHYLASFINVDVRSMGDILKRLVEKKLLIKDTVYLENGSLYVRYKAYNPITIENGEIWIDIDWEEKKKENKNERL